MLADARFFLIDLMPILYRGYFVFLKKPRRTATGLNTSSLALFASTIEQILRTFSPTHLAIAAESLTPTFRHQKFPPYKAQREKMPEDIAAAIGQAEELAAAWGIPVVRADGFEADDVLGTLASRAAAEGAQVVIASPDKDLGQLAAPNIAIFRPGEQAPLSADAICAQWGVQTPAQLIDYLALAGDTSDNVPGIPGVGPKTAKRLLHQFGSVENLLTHAAELSGKTGEAVRAHIEDVKLSKFLVTIVRNVPIDLPLDALRVRPPELARLAPVLRKYELNTVANRLGIAASAAQTQLFGGGEAFRSETAAPTPARRTLATQPHEYRLVQTPAEREALVQQLLAEPRIAFHMQASGLHPKHPRAIGCAFAIAGGQAWYIPLPADEAGQREALHTFEPVLASPSILKVGHDLKYDRTVLRRIGLDLQGPLRDTLLAHYLLAAIDRHDLGYLANVFLDYTPIALTTLLGTDKTRSLADLPPETVLDYAAESADMALRLDDILLPKLKEAALLPLLETCETPLAGVLLDMEQAGVRIDLAALRRFRAELEGEILRLELAIRDYTGAGVNLASPKQMGEFLFGQLQLEPSVKRTPRGQFPTNEELLLKLRDRHPVVDLLLDWRACVKLKNTYVDRLPEHIDPRDGRIHTTFNQTLTDTGRLSSSDPNLQNIPVRSERGQRIRAAFVARAPGWQLLSADYSQVELRIMASMSGDERMIAAFQHGEDIHAQTASVVYGTPLSEVTPQQRSHCKMVNFGIIYGISAFGLASRLRIPRRDAQDLIDAYFAQYPAIKAYMEHSIEAARESGFAKTLFGRRRAVPEIRSRNATTRNAAERIAINMPIQGTAADIIKFAMVTIARRLNEQHLRTQMILQIHDELLFDVPDDEVEAVRPLVREAMESVAQLAVPLRVSLGVGADWLSAH